MSEREYDEIDTALFLLAWNAESDVENECWRRLRCAFNEAYSEFRGLGRIEEL